MSTTRGVQPIRAFGRSAVGPIATARAEPPTHIGHGTAPDRLEDAMRRPTSRLGSYQAAAVRTSVTPCDSSQRSASMAALQPSPAAVTA